MEIRAASASSNYANQTELTSELNLQGNYFIRVERHFHSKND